MHWKVKAAAQNLIAMLPARLSYAAYYRMQRHFGALRRPQPLKRLAAGATIVGFLEGRGAAVAGKRFFEVGTGSRLCVPMALWLCGAGEVFTVDLHPYLRPELVLADLEYMRAHREETLHALGPQSAAAGCAARFQQLLAVDGDFDRLMELMRIRYLAPADAARLPLDAHSIDYHVSFTVLEHIPPDALVAIFREARRVLAPEGLLVHHVDFSDHFAHDDLSISTVNFLRYGERRWHWYAGNRYMYHNRLRIDELGTLLSRAGVELLNTQATVDMRALAELAGGLPLAPRFAGKDPATNATTSAWLVAACGHASCGAAALAAPQAA